MQIVCAAQVEWKLTRGKWRPRLLDYAKAHSNEAVVAVSSSAFRHIDDGDVAAGFAALTKLKVRFFYLRLRNVRCLCFLGPFAQLQSIADNIDTSFGAIYSSPPCFLDLVKAACNTFVH